MRVRRTAAVAFLAATLIGVPASAGASDTTFNIGAPVTVSGPSPFGTCTFGGATGTNYLNTEVEPFVAVNPTNPSNIIGVFQQDRWSDGGAHGLVAARSTNGGASWTSNFAKFSKCADAASQFDRSTDPWVSFDSAGRAYQISLGIDSVALTLSGVEVSTSTDGGANWSAPVGVITDTDPLGINFNDKESITGDWRTGVGAGKAYATWIRGDIPGDRRSFNSLFHAFSFRGLPMFSMTSDGGATWSTPVSMTNSNVYVQGNQIAVLPDGTLVDIGAVLFKGSGNQPSGQFFWTALISKNGGKTWGSPVKIAPLGTALLTNPDIPNPGSLDETVRAGDYLPDVAVDKTTGAIYMVFADHIGGGFNHVKLTKSTDGGKSWSTPADVTLTPSTTHSFNGTVEVTDDGDLAVMYYDFRNNVVGDNTPLETDVWLRHSHDGGATWSADQRVTATSFDMENAPVARGWFLGDYVGMAAINEPGVNNDDLMLFFSVTDGNDNSANVIAVRASR